MTGAPDLQPRRSIAGGAVIVSALAALVLLALAVVILDQHEVRRLLGQTRWPLVVPALAAVAVSYAALSLGMVAVGRIVGIRVPTPVLLGASFVSFALNHVASLGGIAGYSVRVLLLRRYGESPGSVLAMTVVHSYLNTVAMLTLLPVALLYLAAVHPLSRQGTLAAAISGLLSAVVVLVLTVAMLSRRARGRLLGGARRSVGFVLRGRGGRPVVAALEDFGAGLDEGMAALAPHPAAGAVPALLVAADWAATLVAFWFCLDAVGAGVGVGVLLTGFTIGVNAGFLSFVPGGIGVQEGSITATLALLGVGIEQAALAAILFRVVYYFVPFVASLPLYWSLMRVTRGGADTA